MAAKPVKKADPEDWHRADIKAALEKRGYTLRRLADEHGVSPSTLAHTFMRPYPVSEQRIAAVIGVPVQEIWPSRYFPDGQPRLRGIRRHTPGLQSTASNCQSNGNSEGAN